MEGGSTEEGCSVESGMTLGPRPVDPAELTEACVDSWEGVLFTIIDEDRSRAGTGAGAAAAAAAAAVVVGGGNDGVAVFEAGRGRETGAV